MDWNAPERRSTAALTVVLVLVAMLVPVLLSLALASRQARQEQERSAVHYARDVLKRSEAVAAQIGQAFDRMDAIADIGGCGPIALAELQAIDAVSSYLQLVGTVQDDAIVCSSYGLQSPPLPLGEVDYVSALGLRVRMDVRFPFAPDERFIVTENGRFAAVVHKALPVDATVADDEVALAIMSASTGRVLATRGAVDPAWLSEGADLAQGAQRTRNLDGSVVTQLRSPTFDLLSVAAVGNVQYMQVVGRFALVLAPMGLVAGGLLSWWLLRLMRAQLTLAAAIRSGLRDREFSIELQPIVRMTDHQWVGAEVLMRWRRRDGRMVRPDLFIPAAEEAGLAKFLTGRVLELVEPALRAVAKRDSTFFLSINLASDDLHDDDLVDRLGRLLAQSGAQATQLHVEITEQAFVDVARARPQLERLRALGVFVSIDDFGTGYSSLSELVGLQVDALKIDKAFVDTLGSEAVTSHVATHIVEMGHALSLQMIAEGIEQPHQAEALAAMRVHFGQGWLFAPSLPVEEFLLALDADPGRGKLTHDGQVNETAASSTEGVGQQ